MHGWLDDGTVTKPLVGAATAYFVVNTMMIATAIALSSGQSVLRVWNENFLWSAPSYFVGALAAAGSTLISASLRSGWRRWPWRRSS